jgi:hypothetical protein
LQFVGLDPIIMMESKSWNAKSGKKFKLEKDQALNIPQGLS